MSLTPEIAAAKIAAALPTLQAFAEARMRWTCRVERATGGWVTDPATGREVPAPPVVIYRGMFRAKSYRSYEQTPDVGGATLTIVRTDAHLPAVERIPVLADAGVIVADVAAQPFSEGDVIVHVVDGVDGKRFRVAGPHDVTDQTAQRLLVDEGA